MILWYPVINSLSCCGVSVVCMELGKSSLLHATWGAALGSEDPWDTVGVEYTGLLQSHLICNSKSRGSELACHTCHGT